MFVPTRGYKSCPQKVNNRTGNMRHTFKVMIQGREEKELSTEWGGIFYH